MKIRNIFLWMVFSLFVAYVCQAQTPPLLEESFGNYTFPPSGWTTVKVAGTATQQWNRSSSKGHNDNACANIHYMPDGNINDLISPVLPITSPDMYEVSFWIWRPDDSYRKVGEGIEVWANTTPDTVNGSKLLFISRHCSLVPVETAPGWYQYSALIPIAGNVHIIFRHIAKDGFIVFIDDVLVERAPTCRTPSNLQITEQHATSATLSWTDDNGNTVWNVRYKLRSESNWQSEEVNQTSLTLQNLIPNREYDVSVAAVCNDGSLSRTINNSFRTFLGMNSLETFNDGIPNSWTKYTGALTSNSSLSSSTNNGWTSVATSSLSSSEMDAHPIGKIGGRNSHHWIVSPSIELTEASQIEMDIAFSKKNNGEENPSVYPDDLFAVVVSLDDGATWDIANAKIWSGDSTSEHAYLGIFDVHSKHVSIGLKNQFNVPYIGVVKIGLVCSSSVDNGDNFIHVDNFSIRPLSNCVAPLRFCMIGVPAPYSATFVIQASDDNLMWEYELTEFDNPFSGIAGGFVSAPNTNPYNFVIDNLNPQTKYKLRLRTNCETESGVWGDSIVFRTKPLPMDLPWFCDFETSDNPWTFVSPQGTNQWVIADSVAYGGSNRSMYITDHSLPNAYHYNSKSGIAYAYVDILTGDASGYKLSFDWKCKGETTQNNGNDFFKVLLTDTNSVLPKTSFGFDADYATHVIGFHNGEAFFNNSQNDPHADEEQWIHSSCSFPNPGANTIKRLVFAWRTDFSGALQPPAAIDNVEITEDLCAIPSIDSFAISNLMANSVSISIFPADADISPELWLFKLTAANDTQYYTTSTLPLNAVNLQENTEYTIRLWRICGGDTSDVSLVHGNFLTPCNPETTPWMEMFDTNPFDDCWTRGKGKLSDQGNTYVTLSKNGSWVHNSSTFNTPMPGGRIYAPIDAERARWVITPSIDLGDGSETKQLDFDVCLTGSSFSGQRVPYRGYYFNDDRFIVLISEDNGQTWSANNTWIWDSAGTYRPFNELSETPQRIIIPLKNNGMNYSGIVKIAFYAESTRDSVVYEDYYDETECNFIQIDNIQVTPEQACLNPRNLSVTGVTGNSVSIDWIPAENTTSWQYDVVLNNENSEFNEVGADMTEHPFIVTGLMPNSNYKIRIRTSCGNEYSIWTDSVVFSTTNAPVSLPYSNDFETPETYSDISVSNIRGYNQWIIDTAVNNGGSHSLYITDTTATNRLNKYNLTSKTISHAFIDFEVTEGANYEISFDWRAEGEGNGLRKYDFLKVFISDPSDALPASVDDHLPSYDFAGNDELNGSSSWNRATASLNNVAAPSGAKRIIFTWVNDNGGGANPPAAIDNIVIREVSCPTVSNFNVQQITNHSAHFTWDSIQSSSFELHYGEITDSDTNYTIVPFYQVTEGIIEDLQPNTLYIAYLLPVCGSNFGTASPAVTFRTPVNIPFACSFEPDSDTNAWQYMRKGGSARWIIDTATALSGQYSLYVSNNPPQNTYGSNDKTFAYIDVAFSDASEHILSFDWKAAGESSSDYLFVALTDIGENPPTSYNSSFVISRNGNRKYLNQKNSWQHSDIILDTIAQGKSKRIYFAWIANSFSEYNPAGAIDNVSIDVLTCAPPRNFAIANITHNSAAVIANPVEDATNYIVSITGNGNTALHETTSFPFTIQNLDSRTEYSVSISTVCASGDTSHASSPVAFSTVCAPATVPYLEPFTAIPSDSTCWERMGGQFTDGINSNSLTSVATTTGWIRKETNGRSHIKCEMYGRSNCHWIISPLIDLGDEANDYELSFNMWLTQWNATTAPRNIGHDHRFKVLISTNGGYSWEENNAVTWTGDTNDVNAFPLSSISNLPSRYNIPLNRYTGLIRFAFYVESTVHNSAADNDLHIDSLSIDVRPSCPAPGNIVVSEITDNTATIAWTENGSASSWIIKVNDNEFSTTDNPYIITGLPPASLVSVGVKAHCSDSDESIWSNSSFFTKCGTVTEYPYIEDFETGYLGCWNNRDSGEYQWTIKSIPSEAHSGRHCANFFFRSKNKTNMLISPVFDLTTTDTPQLSFAHKQKQWGTDQDTLGVYYRTSENSDWIYLTSFNNDISTYQTDSIILPNASAEYQIGFLAFGNWGYGLYLDDITIKNANPASQPTCVSPNHVAAANITSHSASISWTENGTATSWRIDYNGTVVTANTNPFTLSELADNTTYVVKVKSVCDLDNESNWSATTSFATISESPTPCEKPSGITFSNITATSVTIAWTENGTASSWKIDYNGTVMTVTSNPYVLSGLTANTTYSIKIKAVCSADSESEWSEESSFLSPHIRSFVITSEATNITSASAVLNATITQGTDEVAQQGFEWKLASESTFNSVRVASHNDGLMKYTLDSLSPDTTYTFKAYITIDGNKRYGEPKHFKTSKDVGLTEIRELSDIRLFPNPASKQVTVEMGRITGTVNLTLTDFNGHTVLKREIKADSYQSTSVVMDISHLPQGAYYLHIQNNKKVSTQKLIIQ